MSDVKNIFLKLFLKELYDLRINYKIFYSGSSQLELKSKLKEHLVGRARQFEIHRLSFEEFMQFKNPVTNKEALEEMLIYGSYPAVPLETNSIEKRLYIKDIYQSYIEKDVVEFLKVDNFNALNNMLIMLANQIGGMMNIDRLSGDLRISRGEVERYINILEGT